MLTSTGSGPPPTTPATPVTPATTHPIPPRCALVGLFHETNSFSSLVANHTAFRISRGNEIVDRCSSKSVVAGFVDGAAAEGITLVPLLRASSRKASPPANARDLHPAERIGSIEAGTYAHLLDEVAALLQDGAPWDGVLIANHGSAVSEQYPDADGAFCQMIRENVGKAAIVGICLDMHANVSEALVESTDVCVVWRTTPHIDMHERGYKTAEMVGRAMHGKVKLVQWIEKPPMVVNVTKHFTDVEPMLSVCSDCIAAANRDGILDASVALGSPYNDTQHMGMSFIAVADGSTVAAKEAAHWMALRAWDRRVRLCTPGPARAYGSPDTHLSAHAPELTANEAVRLADQKYVGPKLGYEAYSVVSGATAGAGLDDVASGDANPSDGDGKSEIRDACTDKGLQQHGPVVIMDIGDNIGGGSPGDSTFLLQAALDQGIEGFVQSLVDPEAVAACVKAGIGGIVEGLAIGGKADTLHGTSILVSGVVQAISDGTWDDAGPVHGGPCTFSAGVCASILVACGNITIVLTSKRCDNTSLGLFTHICVQPNQHRIIVAKGVESPRLSFEPVASLILMANTPGITSAEMTSFAFKHRRVPLFPFEIETKWA